MQRPERSSPEDDARPYAAAVAGDVAALADDWGDEERHVLAAVFHALASGRPATTEDVATAADRPAADVEAVLQRRGDQMQHDDAGRIVGWSGLTLEPTRHEVRVGDVTLYAWCALDPYFIAPILGRTLHVRSLDPVTDSRVDVTVRPDGTADASAGVVATLVSRGADRLAADVIGNFCNHVHHFPSREVAERFRPEGIEPVVVGVEVLAATGMAIYQRVWAP